MYVIFFATGAQMKSKIQFICIIICAPVAKFIKLNYN
jgi:hypothetical protein